MSHVDMTVTFQYCECGYSPYTQKMANLMKV